jgi:hypothetical protein
MKRLISLVIMLNLFCLFQAGAQDSLRLVSGEGTDFTLLRNNVKQSFTLSKIDKDSFIIKEGDRLLTGENTFLELLSQSGRIRIMVGESSSVSFDSLDSTQGTLFSLSYGHLRGLLEEKGPDLWISGGDTACRVSQGDFGFLLANSLTLNQPEIKTRIYVLDGSVEVRQRINDPAQDKRVDNKTPIAIEKGEMVVTSNWEQDTPLVPVPFDFDYGGYWKSHPFSHIKIADPVPVQPDVKEDNPVVQEPLITKIEESSSSEKESFPINDNVQIISAREKYQNVVDMGTTALVLGTVFMTGAAVSYMLGEGTLGTGMVFMGGINLLAGAGALGYTYFSPPPE